MLELLQAFFWLGVGFLVLGLMLGKPIAVRLTAWPDDEAHLKARFEGLQGEVGPYCKVVKIEPDGVAVEFVSRSMNVYRQYLVTMDRPHRPLEVQTVKLEATWLDIFSMWFPTKRERRRLR